MKYLAKQFEGQSAYFQVGEELARIGTTETCDGRINERSSDYDERRMLMRRKRMGKLSKSFVAN